MAERKVDAIVYAESEGDTTHLAIEAQIDHQVVVEKVEEGKNLAYDAHSEENHLPIVFYHPLITDHINHLNSTTDN